MGSKQLPVYVQDILNSVAKKQGFVNYSVDSKSGSQAGDGFVSELFSITIAEDDSEKRLNLMCKLAHSNRDHRKTICSDLLFDREAAFYDKLLPVFTNFQSIKNAPREHQFLAYPTCYSAISNEDSEQFAIILEDLRPLGFKMWNKTKSSPIENVLLVMRELGKYHGLSLALKDQQRNEFAGFENVKETMKIALLADSWQTLFKASFDRAIKTLKNEEYKCIMQHIKDNYAGYIDNCIGADAAGSFGVLSHGIFPIPFPFFHRISKSQIFQEIFGITTFCIDSTRRESLTMFVSSTSNKYFMRVRLLMCFITFSFPLTKHCVTRNMIIC